MTDLPWALLLFLKDFTGRGSDRFWWHKDGELIETDAHGVVDCDGTVVCHDFWIIRDVIFDAAKRLPKTIVDLDEFRISTSGIPSDRLAREKHDITAALEAFGADPELCSAYRRMFNKAIPFDPEIACRAAKALEELFETMLSKADSAGEKERFFGIEVPVYHILQSAMAAGIHIDSS